ncbi:heavy-metal-associated domain-containing protein [Streptococcus sp. 10F2]
MKQTVQLAGLSCQNCVKHTTAAFSKLAGVESVTIDLDQQLAQVTTNIVYQVQDYQEVLGSLPYKIESVR